MARAKIIKVEGKTKIVTMEKFNQMLDDKEDFETIGTKEI